MQKKEDKESYKSYGKFEKPRTEFEERKIAEGVFDKATLTSLFKLFNKHNLEITSMISQGKEANVYYGTIDEKNEKTGEIKKREVAVKIFSVDAADFRTMEKYIRGDPRFHVRKERRSFIYSWTQKEFRNLSKMHEAINCPEPIAFHNNVLVMEFIGDNGAPAPRMKDLPPNDPEKFFNKILDHVRKIYKAGLVHGDLSEYNVLNNGEPVIIDVSQSVLLSHPMAQELLERDVKNILKYFKNFGVEMDALEALKFIKNF
jgi:RIO kinase 1